MRSDDDDVANCEWVDSPGGQMGLTTRRRWLGLIAYLPFAKIPGIFGTEMSTYL